MEVRLPFRLKLILILLCILLSFFLLASWAGSAMIRNRLIEERDRTFREMFDHIPDSVLADPRQVEWLVAAVLPEGRFEVVDTTGLQYGYPDSSRPGIRSFQDTVAADYRVLTHHRGERYLRVRYSLREINASMREIMQVLGMMSVLMLISIITASFVLITRLLRPLRSLRRYTDEIIHEPLDLMQRLPVRRNDEIGQLIENMNSIIQKMRLSVRQMLMFSSLASHELRTPLTVIRNQLENALHPKATDAELRRVIASCYDEVLRLSHVVNEMLTLSRLQSGTFQITLQPLDFQKFLLEFYQDAVQLGRDKDIDVQLSVGQRVLINGDNARLRQVFLNLLDNALRHTDSGGTVRLAYRVTDGAMECRFEDTGSGILPEDLPKIFDPFYRGRMNPEKQKSSGLGLAIVRMVIEAHRGTILVESERGKGTIFRIVLPIRERVKY